VLAFKYLWSPPRIDTYFRTWCHLRWPISRSPNWYPHPWIVRLSHTVVELIVLDCIWLEARVTNSQLRTALTSRKAASVHIKYHMGVLQPWIISLRHLKLWNDLESRLRRLKIVSKLRQLVQKQFNKLWIKFWTSNSSNKFTNLLAHHTKHNLNKHQQAGGHVKDPSQVILRSDKHNTITSSLAIAASLQILDHPINTLSAKLIILKHGIISKPPQALYPTKSLPSLHRNQPRQTTCIPKALVQCLSIKKASKATNSTVASKHHTQGAPRTSNVSNLTTSASPPKTTTDSKPQQYRVPQRSNIHMALISRTGKGQRHRNTSVNLICRISPCPSSHKSTTTIWLSIIYNSSSLQWRGSLSRRQRLRALHLNKSNLHKLSSLEPNSLVIHRSKLRLQML